MTGAERELWIQAKADYEHALACAVDAWKGSSQTDGGPEPTPEAIQAAAATIMIHVTRMREKVLPHYEGPSTSTAAKRQDGQTSAPVTIPPCPQCGGPMVDFRAKKKTPKSPDFRCRDKNCKDDKGFGSALWLKDLPKVAQATTIRNDIDSYAEMPHALQDDDGSSLPF